MAVVIVLFLALFGCDAAWHVKHDNLETVQHDNLAAQSWDQQNLKREDAGCPTSNFVPDGTVSKLCPMDSR